MTIRNFLEAPDGIRFTRWSGSREFLHAEPRQTIGNTHLVGRTRKSGITK